jgi:phage shock protein PspC (stress-responsive transcriptional regulator)
MPIKKPGLQRSRDQRILFGVCGGLAEWLGWNATLVRLLFVAVSIASAAFPGILVYVILWILMPLRERERGREILEDWETERLHRARSAV